MPSTGTSALRPSWALLLALLAAAAAALAEERVLERGSDPPIHYRTVAAGAPDSARATAHRMLQLLAEGDIEEAAVLSTTPRRRYEELAKFRATVGVSEFKRVFGEYVASGEPLAELAIGSHRMLIWDLAGAEGRRLSAQYYVQIEERFLLDDVPNNVRNQLRTLLESFRTGKTVTLE